MTKNKQTSTPAPICYLEIPAPDIEASGHFYSSVFNWKITPSHLSDNAYWEFNTGDGHLTGGLDPSIPISTGGANDISKGHRYRGNVTTSLC